ncbi:DUF4175 family protein [Mucilaginibacter gynuensis]|uniref:DUF4175 family protein n=1 Tax=Mucilaginibacter gynuensis TaxID=1302236 RepID=A0ABP8GRR9_9SPHI
MANTQGIHKLQQVKQRYIFYRVLAALLLAAALGIAVGAVLFIVFHLPVYSGIAVFVVMLLILLAISKSWQISDANIAAMLNSSYAELEESAQLIIKPINELNLLETLQVQKVNEILQTLPGTPKHYAGYLKFPLIALLVAVVFGAILSRVDLSNNSPLSAAEIQQKKALPPEKVLPQIESLSISITPPAYTHKPQREQDRFTITVEDGGRVSWNIKTNIIIKNAYLLLNDKEVIPLKSADNKGWSAQKVFNKPGFYQVGIDGKLSELYQIQLIKDTPPLIHIKTPKPYTYIDAGEVPKVTVNTQVSDDYGVNNAFINATVAKGKGESVKFKEYKLAFPTVFSGNTKYDVQRVIDLNALKMEPGDELYFYVQAHDTHNQQSRTDVYTVAIQDTAELLSMDGVLTGANIKPEFFRSERQIIIDAEQLLKEKDTISAQRFKDRSNDLGIDQKLLRLRYGKFLGEEAENNIGDDRFDKDDHDHDGSEDNGASDFGNAQKAIEPYSHKHDNAEDATYFEPAIKEQLKATLTEMWKAELQLRLFKPQAALPFAYKALRLLKDLQQKSRSYVAKASYKPTPLKWEKRLSGELDKIISPTDKETLKPAADQHETLKKAVTVLGKLKYNPKINDSEKRLLQLANLQLSQRASVQPAAYLPALSAMRRLLWAGEKINAADIGIVERAVQKTLVTVKAMPKAEAAPADMGLSADYFKNLNR